MKFIPSGSTRVRLLMGLFGLTAAWASTCVCADEKAVLDVTMTVDFGSDVGQNFGSLFEAYDDRGKVVAGAGFLGAYNTQPRSNRRRLNFFLKPKAPEYTATQLPRVNAESGVYLSELQGLLLARSRSGRDAGFYALDATSESWFKHGSVVGYYLDVAGEPLLFFDQQIICRDHSILWVNDQIRIRENYYANGQLVLRLQNLEESATSNRLVAVPWTTDKEFAELDEAANPVLVLRTHGEFVYAFGQLGDEVLAATNTGGVYALRDQTWRVIVEPGPHSYQVYSMLNYYDRLLLGHYPSGEIYEYDGKELRHLPDWPPVMPGVSNRAREAQTLAIYGGDLYAGVWPWAEVWRFDRNDSQWQFADRMLTHPELTAKIVHPYENECTAAGLVLNAWGQRVTSLVPFDDSLYISTSSKSGIDAVPAFLSEDQGLEYGRVHKWRLPGQLSAEINWTGKPTTIRCLLTADRMSLWQDGVLLSEQSLKSNEVLTALPDRVTWGRGVYGPLRGHLISRKSNLDRVFLGAYVKFSDVLAGAVTTEERQQRLDVLLDRFRESELEVVMPYVTTTSGQAAFPSEVIAERIYGDWDPLAYLIEGARQRQLRVCPVVCVLASGHTEPRGILRTHPEWATRNIDGQIMGYISPANSSARDWVTSLTNELVRNYAIDGLLLDYMRYCNGPLRLDAAGEADFAVYRAQHPEVPEAQLFQTFREDALTTLMRQISLSARRVRPGLQLAIYSWGPHVASNHPVAQAWPKWSREGLIDMVNISGYCYPKNYGAEYLNVFSRRIGDAVRLNQSQQGRADMTFCLGVKTSHGEIQAASDVNDYLTRAVPENVKGVSIFTWFTLGAFLDEVNASRYIPAFRERIESQRADETATGVKNQDRR